MYGTWLIGALVTIAVPILLALTGWISGWRAWGYVLLGLAILWLVLLLVCAYRRFNHWYEVTNQRLKHRDGILFRRINRIELIDIDDVKYSQGPVETLLGVGSIVVESSDKSHPELTLRGIANVRHVMEMIDGARRAERIKRSVHIESV
jgi:membrane protein YdbS with pleckstrin-like domain